MKKLQRENKMLLVLLMMLSMLTLILVIPTSFAEPYTSDFSYEEYGPHLDNIHYVFTGTPETSFLGLEAGDYDIIDWPLTETWFNTWGNPAVTDVRIMGYGGEFGFYLFDTRHNNTKPINPPYSTQTYVMTGDPTEITMDLSDLGEGTGPFDTRMGAQARHAIAHMIDRTWIVTTVMGGLGEPNYSPAPAAQGAFVNPNVEKHPQDFDKARAILDRAGYIDTDEDGWRDIPGTDEEIVLDFYIRLGPPRQDAGERLANDIEAELDIHVNRQVGGSGEAFDHFMVDREMDMYTGGWINVIFPDHYLDMYSSAGWWYAGGFSPNYGRYCGWKDYWTDPDQIPGNGDEIGSVESPVPDGQIDFDPEVDRLAHAIVENTETADVKQACWDVQEILMKKENVYTIPMVSTASPKAFRTYKVGETEVPGNEWKGIVNETGQGVNNFFTFLNAYTDNEPDSGTIIYGLSYGGLDFLNPIYAGWYQTWEILGKVYDSMLYLDPVGAVDMMPWVASEFIHSREYDGVQGKEVSTLSFTLREDVFWHDGEQLDADDVIFSLVTVLEKLTARGDPPPFWESNVREINRIVKIDDFHIKVYLKLATFFAPIWVGGNIIMPEHIWNPLLDDLEFNIESFAPDPNIIGSGPFEMDVSDYSEGVAADVYAYKPASAGYMNFGPIQNFVMEGEIAEHLPNTNTYWVGVGYTGAVKVACTLNNLDLTTAYVVTSELEEDVASLGVQVVPCPAHSSTGIQFARAVTGGIGTVISGPVYKLTDTYIGTPGVDIDTSRVVFKVTANGDVISTGDIPGTVDVNMFDALRVSATWGSGRAYEYPPADINFDEDIGLTEALIIVANFGAAGA